MKILLVGALMFATAAPVALPVAAAAQGFDQRSDREDRRDDRRDRRDDRRDRREDRREERREDRRDIRAANDYRWQGDNSGNWEPSRSYREGNYRERNLGRNDRIYRGNDGRAYCKRSDGTTGLVIGALGGGVLGNLVGGGTLGTILGAGGGGLLGRSVDRGNVKCR